MMVGERDSLRRVSDVGTPAPGEELNEGPPAPARPAATVMILRGGNDALEVLMVQRNPDSRFMGGAWVFPGGAVDEADGLGDEGLREAALREVIEEVGITLPSADHLVPYSRWITPREVKIRFDTWFYLALLPDGAEPVIDGSEIVDWRWETPDSALEAWQRDELMLVFPTIRHLEQIAQFGSADALIEHAGRLDVQPVEPRIEIVGEVARVLLPGDDGYPEP